MSISKRNRKDISKAFKLSGLTISSDAVVGVWRQLRHEEDLQTSLQVIIGGIKTYLKQNQVKGSVIDSDVVEKVVAELTSDETDVVHDSLQLISAFDHANLCYKREKKEFYIAPRAGAAVNGVAKDKIEMYRSRLALIHQRLLRQKIFHAPLNVVSSRSEDSYIKLCPVESLIGTTGVQRVLGMLFKHHDKLYLEDYNSRIELLINEDTIVHEGIYTETCAVLVEGTYADGSFVVGTLGMPPSETRAETLPVLGHVSMMGLHFNSESYANMLRVETQESPAPLVVLSDVHLDRAEVLDKLRRMFHGLSALKPSVIVFIGNFSAQPFGNSYADRALYQKGFDALADILVGYPELCKTSQFVFIPGPNDPGSVNALPRVPIPTVFAKKLRNRVQHIHFGTNPSRLRYFTQEFVFFRENLVSKLRRHQIVEPTMEHDATLEVTAQLAKTILDQGHLCPLPLSARPVYWAFDHALRLYPQPTTVFLADQYDQYLKRYKDTDVCNPGSFSTDFSFIVYWPGSQKTDFSRID